MRKITFMILIDYRNMFHDRINRPCTLTGPSSLLIKDSKAMAENISMIKEKYKVSEGTILFA